MKLTSLFDKILKRLESNVQPQIYSLSVLEVSKSVILEHIFKQNLKIDDKMVSDTKLHYF